MTKDELIKELEEEFELVNKKMYDYHMHRQWEQESECNGRKFQILCDIKRIEKLNDNSVPKAIVP